MSRALPGGMLNSKEKTEYEDWLEKLHKKIDSIKPEKDTCSMPLMDSECGANGCHNYDGSLITDKNRVHGIYHTDEDIYKMSSPKEENDRNKKFESIYYNAQGLGGIYNLNEALKKLACLEPLNESNESLMKDHNYIRKIYIQDIIDATKELRKRINVPLEKVKLQHWLDDFEKVLIELFKHVDMVTRKDFGDDELKKDIIDSVKEYVNDEFSVVKETITETDTWMELRNLDNSPFTPSIFESYDTCYSRIKEFSKILRNVKYA